MKRISWVALALMIALLPLSWVSTQDSAGISLDVIGINSTNLSQVAINASILDASGQLVSGLHVANFSVGGDLAGLATVTGVANVTDDDLAFASVLVIDTSSSMADRPIREAKQAAARYVMSLRPNDPVAIVTFSTEASLIVDYTTNRDLLLRAIDSLAYGGQTALYDATHLGIEIADRAPSPRRAVVILSDGGEYGDISEHGRDESVKAATVNGIPVYTVGLGWSRSIDRRFLELISSETNAEFYYAPSLEQLTAIYQKLAGLFRTQYIITLEADVPADGTRYDFTLEVLTADGRGASGSATLRAPIPIPLVFLPDELFTEALRESTQIQVEILADQEIESIEIALDGEVVSTEETFTIEPEQAEPGEHRLDITVSDVEGDVGTLSAEFEIAALPPTVADDFDPAALADSRAAEVITVDAGGQTEITQVEFFIDDELYQVDDEAPYELNLDPFELSPGEHTLSVRASNAGGQSTTVDRQFDVDVIAPRLEIEGVAEDTVISDSVVGSVLASGQSPITSISTDPGLAVVVEDNRMQFTLNAAELPPGKNTIAVRAVDAAGAEIVQTLEFEVAALPPTVELSGVAIDGILQGAQDVAVRAGGQTDITQIEVAFDDGPREVIRDESFTIPAEELGDGEHEVEVTVRNAGGESTTVRLPFTIALPPTPTFTPTSTHTPLPTDTPTATPTQSHTSLPTDTAVPSATLPPTVTDQPTPEAPISTDIAAEPARPSPTEPPSDTPAPTDTYTPQPSDTFTPVPTDTHTPQPTDTSTPAPTDTHTPQPSDTSTPEPTDTHTPQPSDTNTPEPTDTHTPIPTDTITPVPTGTDTPVPTDTFTPVPTDTNTPVPTDTDTPIPTDTDTPVPTDTDTPIPTDTDTPIPTDTNTPVPTDTDTPIPTDTDTPVPTDTNTPVPTDTDTPIPTGTDTPIPTDTDTPVPTDTDTPIPTDTHTPIPTDTDTPVPTDTNTPIPTDTDTPVPTDTDTPIPTDTDTPIPTDTHTPIPTDTDTPVPTDTNTPIPTDTDTPVPTDTDTPIPTDTDTPIPTDTDTPIPTDTDTPVPTDTDTPVPTDTNTPVPTDTDTPVPTDTDTPVPTDTDTPIPTDTDTPEPTDTDTPIPTDTDTPAPTDTDTPVPTDTDTPTPTATPSPTVDVTETAEAEASLTAVVQGTLDQRATEAEDERATAEAEETEAPTEAAAAVQPTVTDAPTQEVVVEPTAQPTLTPVTITEIEAPSADEPDRRDEVIAILAVAAGLLLLLLLFLLSRRNRG